ncbi:pyocin knob domain-containing protein [Acinetobacter pittii]|uniref:pyocin knob domain-containing protein n=1 Tax=Acinetobacter pittii TaxID=48296 RepID=UPI000CA0B775|nr:pyocin knob domain-containing protein [Acinetobacter pittii]AUM27126.1 hypothetical protein BVD86_09605 [Acinetobacter pittii]
MATNWNAVLANINNASDILAILRKVLGLLDGKVDLTKIDEIINDITSMQTDVDVALVNVTSALSEFDSESQEAIQQVIAAGLMEGFSTEAELLATRPLEPKKYAKAEDTDVIWFWNKPEGSPDGNYWISTGLSELERAKKYADDTKLSKSFTISSEHLNGLVEEGVYFQTIASNATAANGYPTHAQTIQSITKVFKKGAVLFQSIEARGIVATRQSFDGGVNWTAFIAGLGQVELSTINTNLTRIENQFKKPLHFSVSGTFGSVNYNKTTKVLSWATSLIATTKNNSNSRISIDPYSVTFSGAAFETLYLDLNNIPSNGNINSANFSSCLKLGKYFDTGPDAFKEEIYQVPIAQMTPQGVLAKCAGVLFDIVSEAPKIDGFRYTKTATALSVFLPAKNGNLIRFNIPHEVIAFDENNARSQLDLWRIERALETDASFTELQEIATWGEVEFTMREKAFSTDHVGGTHGDEKLSSAFFVVDGVYKPQDFSVLGTQIAKEIRLEQISIIYRLNTNIPIAQHRKSLLITDKWLLAQQEVEMLVTTEVDRFWTAMLTMRRKSVNDVIQITKYDIRDGALRDISTVNFEKVYTPLKNLNPVLVCGDKYSGSVELSDISGFLSNADCYISNDAAYNKIYVSAIGSTTSGVVLEAGKKFSWTTKYKIDAV